MLYGEKRTFCLHFTAIIFRITAVILLVLVESFLEGKTLAWFELREQALTSFPNISSTKLDSISFR